MVAGKREQKRLAARQAMEAAAVDIAYHEGISAVSVERICNEAKVSRSTFFNYFPTLEYAIFGSPLTYDPAITNSILEEHSHDLVTASMLIVMRSVRNTPDNELARKRYALFVRNPGITSKVSWGADTSRGGVVKVIQEWLEAHPEHARLPHLPTETEARMSVSLSILLGDEIQRFTSEVDGEFITEPGAHKEVQSQIAALSALRSESN